jgi:glutamate dehydrogenase
MAARAVFVLADLWRQLDALDGKIAGATQLDLYLSVQHVLNRNVAWFLRHAIAGTNLSDMISRNRSGFQLLKAELTKVGTPGALGRLEQLVSDLVGLGVARGLAADIAHLIVLADTPAIVDIARVSGRSIPEAAQAFLAVGDRFGIDDLLGRMSQIKVADDYDRLAIAGAEGTFADARHSMALAVLGASGSGQPDLEAWAAHQPERVKSAEQALAAIMAAPELTVSRLTVAATRLADIARTQG